MIPPLLVRQLIYSLLGKLVGALLGRMLPLLGRYRPLLIGLVGVALVAAGGYAWHKLQSLAAYKASVAELTAALQSERAAVLAVTAERDKAIAVIEQRNRRVAALETHARELTRSLREIPADACLDTAAPPAALDLLR